MLFIWYSLLLVWYSALISIHSYHRILGPTNLLLTASHSNLPFFVYTLIDRVGMQKHFGLTLKPDLCWDAHLSNIYKLINIKFSILYRVKYNDRQIIDLMFKSMVRSHIDYVLQVLGLSLSNKQILQGPSH